MNGSSREPMRSAPQKKSKLPSPTRLGRNHHQLHGDPSGQASPDTALPLASQILEAPDTSDSQLREAMGGAGNKKESTTPSLHLLL